MILVSTQLQSSWPQPLWHQTRLAARLRQGFGIGRFGIAIDTFCPPSSWGLKPSLQRPGKGEPQKGSAQKVTFKSLKSDLKVISSLDPLMLLPFSRPVKTKPALVLVRITLASCSGKCLLMSVLLAHSSTSCAHSMITIVMFSVSYTHYLEPSTCMM